ncbi:hypothetical protein KL933_000562 [Ogataea haglerorum]|uniref:Uncharacterized protein n=1 Tax=Ogataea haglerorum TaxID=1937702 RepID=A0AAN6D9T6_9ASCO|nr:hypothetical protein KL933_000562 [Ogataea haglerorum]
MLRVADVQDDHALAQYVIDELAEAELPDLGSRLPEMLERYKKAGLDVPARLLEPAAQTIAELFHAGRWRMLAKQALDDDEYCVSLACDGRPLAPCFNTKKLSFPLRDTLAIELANGSVAALSLLETAAETPAVRLVAAHTILPPREDAPQPHVAAPVAEKSFVQKYWMYFVPPLIILMVMSPQ